MTITIPIANNMSVSNIHFPGKFIILLRFGFQHYREYAMLNKYLANHRISRSQFQGKPGKMDEVVKFITAIKNEALSDRK